MFQTVIPNQSPRRFQKLQPAIAWGQKTAIAGDIWFVEDGRYSRKIIDGKRPWRSIRKAFSLDPEEQKKIIEIQTRENAAIATRMKKLRDEEPPMSELERLKEEMYWG